MPLKAVLIIFFSIPFLGQADLNSIDENISFNKQMLMGGKDWFCLYDDTIPDSKNLAEFLPEKTLSFTKDEVSRFVGRMYFADMYRIQEGQTFWKNKPEIQFRSLGKNKYLDNEYLLLSDGVYKTASSPKQDKKQGDVQVEVLTFLNPEIFKLNVYDEPFYKKDLKNIKTVADIRRLAQENKNNLINDYRKCFSSNYYKNFIAEYANIKGCSSTVSLKIAEDLYQEQSRCYKNPDDTCGPYYKKSDLWKKFNSQSAYDMGVVLNSEQYNPLLKKLEKNIQDCKNPIAVDDQIKGKSLRPSRSLQEFQESRK